jgi:hypothetical protein
MKAGHFFKGFIFLSCAVMTGWLLRFEAFPTYFTTAAMGYRSLVTREALLLDNWTKITFNETPIGYSQTQLSVREENPDEAALLQNRTVLQIKVLGVPQKVTSTATVVLDQEYRLQRFDFLLYSRQYTAHIKGKRSRGRMFDVVVQTGAGSNTLQVEIPDDAVIYSPMNELAMSRLRPGQRMRIKTFDPITLRTATVLVEAVREEEIFVMDETHSTTVLTLTYLGFTMRAWMSKQGRILRQETPLGWTIEATDHADAMSLEFDASGMDDVILANAIPLHGTIANQSGCRAMTVRMEEFHLEPEMVTSYRQEVSNVEEGQVELTMRKIPWPEESRSIEELKGLYPEYLVSTPFVQSDHRDIVKQAKKIIGTETDSLAASARIFDWVYGNVEKIPTVSLPSALDVLKQRKGDCNEHTYLYTALARAVGIPAQIRIGLVYHQNAMYFHAWPSVYVGEWVEMDPTLGQQEVDVTHIALLEGEIDRQMELMKVIGRLSIHIVDQEY